MLDDAREETVSQTGDGEPDTEEAEALAAALNHSAERAQTLWFSFLTFMLYLAVATGTTTHRMLFREDPLNLPVLNIPLPLVAFYILTPIIFRRLPFLYAVEPRASRPHRKEFRRCAGARDAGGWRRARKLPHAHREHLVRAIAGRRQAGAQGVQRQALELDGADHPRARAGRFAADVRGQVPALSQRANDL